MSDQVGHRFNLLPAMTSSFFLVFLIGIYSYASIIQQEVASRTVTSTLSGVSWIVFYPEWFFQSLKLFMILALAMLLASLALYFEIPYVQGKPRLRISLDTVVFVYFLSMLGTALFDLFSEGLGPERIVWFPFVGASAYTITVVLYSIAGLWLLWRFGWKGVVPLALIGILQEGTWNLGYYVMYPSFLSTVASASWLEYVAVMVVTAPLLIVLQRKWFKVDLRRNLSVLVFPAYFLLYFLLGMPTVDGTAMAVHTNTLLFEGTYVGACMVTYLGGVRLDAKS